MAVIETLKNGLTVIVEEIPYVESAAYDLLIPGGIIHDNPNNLGANLLLAEITSRGAGPYNSRQLSEAFDERGIRHSEGGGFDAFSYRGILLAHEIEHALGMVGHMVARPTFPEDELESIASILIQDIRSLDDRPSRKASVELAVRYYPGVHGRSTLGVESGIRGATLELVRQEWGRLYHPKGSVLSVAGKVKPRDVLALCEDVFGDWHGDAQQPPAFTEPVLRRMYHIPAESAQLQIILMYPSTPFGHPLYYAAKVANGILSGGAFGRLFVEVREKRGLCYSVYSSQYGTREYGTVVAYAGTTPDRAQETLDVMSGVLVGLAGTITDEELSRAKANLLSSLIISEESTGSRSSSNAGDWWVSRRVRTLDEIKASIQGVTASDIEEYLTVYPPTECSVLTLGSRELQRPGGNR